MCIAAVGVRMAAPLLNSLIGDLLLLAKSNDPATVSAVLELLSFFPPELDTINTTQTHRMQIKQVLRDNINNIISFVQDSLHSPNIKVRLSSLDCLHAWIAWGIPFSLLFTGQPKSIMVLTFEAIGNQELFKVAIDALTELFTPPSTLTSSKDVANTRLCFDMPGTEDYIKWTIVQVLQLHNMYQQALAADNGEVCSGLASLAAAVGTSNPAITLNSSEGLSVVLL